MNATSGSIDVAIATFKDLPDLLEDERLVGSALEARGFSARPVVWDDPSVEWSDVRLCLIRSVWDYHLRRDEFLEWIDSLPPSVQVWNPPEVLRWNSHKGYLRELEGRGVPIVPTEWFEPGDEPDVASIVRANGWDSVVIKPVISANAHKTLRFDGSDIDAGQKHLKELLTHGDAMIQRFMDGVHDVGERCLIVIDGEIAHAVRKTTVFDPAFEDRPPLVDIAPEEEALARAALEAAGFEYLYARVDMVRDETGTARLMELEMLEPDLYLGEKPSSAELLADRVAARLGD